MTRVSAAYTLQTSEGGQMEIFIVIKKNNHESWELPVYPIYCFFF